MHERKSLDFLEESINRNRDFKGNTGESTEGSEERNKVSVILKNAPSA